MDGAEVVPKGRGSPILLQLDPWEPREELTAELSNQQENWGHSLLYRTALVVLWFRSFMERKQMESLTLGVDKLKS